MTKNLTCLKCGAEYVAKKLFPFGKAACPSCGAKNPLRQKRTAETEEEGELLLTFAVDTLDEKALAKRDRVMAKNFKWKLLRDKSGYILQKCKKGEKFALFCYLMNIASPKEKNRYFSSTAFSYAFITLSRPARALISIIRVLSGRWKLVIRASTALKL